MQARLRIFSITFLLAYLALCTRLFFLQVVKGKQLSQEARSQYQENQTIVASRGNILADDGSFLAAQEDAYLVFAYLPELRDDPSKIADKLAPLFLESKDKKLDRNEIIDELERLKTLLTKNDIFWVPLKHKVSSDVKKNIEALNISGIGFERQERRVYPEASSAAHLLGFVGKNEEGEDQGYFGLEGFYDLALSGKHGYVSRESDAQGMPILISESREISAIEGVDLFTSIDKTIQLVVDKNLGQGLEKYGASAGTVIVLEAKTGAILATASYPSYDPREYPEYPYELFKDPAVSFTFEPGSIFKVLVMSAALDSGIVSPDTKCEACSGPLKVDNYYIETWNGKYHPDSSMVDVIVNSDNVGMAWVAQKLGVDNIFNYLTSFGIGKLTGVDLQGEATPRLRERDKWNMVDLSTAGFGQGVAVTPIQMVSAVSVIANKGISIAPFVVNKILGEGWEETIVSKEEGRVISEETAAEITAMMVEAAKYGEAKWTHLKGFKVAGKTGTAQIPIAGHYDEEKTVASFVGFAPADDPKFVMLVTLREPTSSPWASETAAPLWYSIAKDLFMYFGIQPES